jgi:heat shock protein HtpX
MSAAAGAGLSTHIWNNNLRSLFMVVMYPFVLLAIVWGICFAVGYMLAFPYDGAPVSQSFAAAQGVSLGHNVIAAYWPLIFGAAGMWMVVAYFFQARMIRMLSHAHTVRREDEPELYNLLENLCISRGMQMPKLEIIETEGRNAFASGIDEASYTVTVTRGLMTALQRDELEAVLAHELTHIRNGDVRLLIISIIFTGMVSFMAQMVWHSIRHNLFYARGNSKKDGRVMIILLIVAAIIGVGYLASILTRFAISRKREFMADAGAIEMTKNPEAMMRALKRISENDKIPEAASDVAMMCTASSSRFLGLFMTHPPIEDRLAAIAAVSGASVPE